MIKKQLISGFALFVLSIASFTYSTSAKDNNFTNYDTDSFTVSASVALSDLWKDTITQKSKAGVKEKKGLNEESVLNTQIVGIDNELMKKEKITAEIYVNGSFLKTLDAETDENGMAEFKFTPENRGLYTINFIDKTYGTEFQINDKLNLLYL